MAKFIHPSVAAILPRIVEHVFDSIGDKVDRIVLHGSTTKEGAFRPGQSDVDVAVLLIPGNTIKFADQFDLRDRINEELNGDWQAIELSILSADHVDQYQNFPNCYEGSVHQGVILYDSGREGRCDALSVSDARQKIAEHYLNQSWSWIAQTHPVISTSPWTAARSACRALHALLVTHDFNFSPKTLRWNLNALYETARTFHPELAELEASIAMLPSDLAMMEWEYAEFPTLNFTERRRLISRAMRVVRRIERIMGCKVSHSSPLHFRTKNGLRKVFDDE